MKREYWVRPKFWMHNPRLGVIWFVTRKRYEGFRFHVGREDALVSLGWLWINVRYLRQRATYTVMITGVDKNVP